MDPAARSSRVHRGRFPAPRLTAGLARRTPRAQARGRSRVCPSAPRPAAGGGARRSNAWWGTAAEDARSVGPLRCRAGASTGDPEGGASARDLRVRRRAGEQVDDRGPDGRRERCGQAGPPLADLGAAPTARAVATAVRCAGGPSTRFDGVSDRGAGVARGVFDRTIIAAVTAVWRGPMLPCGHRLRLRQPDTGTRTPGAFGRDHGPPSARPHARAAATVWATPPGPRSWPAPLPPRRSRTTESRPQAPPAKLAIST